MSHYPRPHCFLPGKEFLIFHLDPAPAPALGPSSQIVAESDEKNTDPSGEMTQQVKALAAHAQRLELDP